MSTWQGWLAWPSHCGVSPTFNPVTRPSNTGWVDMGTEFWVPAWQQIWNLHEPVEGSWSQQTCKTWILMYHESPLHRSHGIQETKLDESFSVQALSYVRYYIWLIYDIPLPSTTTNPAAKILVAAFQKKIKQWIDQAKKGQGLNSRLTVSGMVQFSTPITLTTSSQWGVHVIRACPFLFGQAACRIAPRHACSYLPATLLELNIQRPR